MNMRTPYSSDVSDEQWVLVEPVITAWKAPHLSVSGHQGRNPMRELVNVILYQNRSGCQWGLLPHDLSGTADVLALLDRRTRRPTKRESFRPWASPDSSP